MTEPEFWDSYLYDEPICKQLVANWEPIRDEILRMKDKFPQFFGPYPKFKITDLETQKKVKMYENNWTVSPISKYDENYNEVESVKKHAGDNLEHLIQKYRKRVLPTIHKIISEVEENEILSNVFVSVLQPGVIIRPHQGYSKEYMRIHLGLICDPGCEITVGETTRTWEEGKLIAFKDGGPYYHSVVHNGTNDRYILSIDLKLTYLKQYIEIL